jgi:hypothetical protein
MHVFRVFFFSWAVILFGISAVCEMSAKAQQSTPPLSALPRGDFQFTGNWTCEGAFGNGKLHKSTYTGAVILGGKWLELTEQDVLPSSGYLAKYLIGWDAQQKRLVEFDANNFSAATYSSDSGWSGNVLTMTSAVTQDARAPYAANRFVYSITDPETFTVDWQISRSATLNWITSDHLACRRIPKA